MAALARSISQMHKQPLEVIEDRWVRSGGKTYWNIHSMPYRMSSAVDENLFHSQTPIAICSCAKILSSGFITGRLASPKPIGLSRDTKILNCPLFELSIFERQGYVEGDSRLGSSFLWKESHAESLATVGLHPKDTLGIRIFPLLGIYCL